MNFLACMATIIGSLFRQEHDLPGQSNYRVTCDVDGNILDHHDHATAWVDLLYVPYKDDLLILPYKSNHLFPHLRPSEGQLALTHSLAKLWPQIQSCIDVDPAPCILDESAPLKLELSLRQIIERMLKEALAYPDRAASWSEETKLLSIFVRKTGRLAGEGESIMPELVITFAANVNGHPINIRLSSDELTAPMKLAAALSKTWPKPSQTARPSDWKPGEDCEGLDPDGGKA